MQHGAFAPVVPGSILSALRRKEKEGTLFRTVKRETTVHRTREAALAEIAFLLRFAKFRWFHCRLFVLACQEFFGTPIPFSVFTNSGLIFCSLRPFLFLRLPNFFSNQRNFSKHGIAF